MADRISSLPDDVLCHILSFLPTEEVVSTMLHSKRWEKLWLYVPVLDLNDETHLMKGKRYSRFLKFVYVVILARAGLQPLIKRFHLISRVSKSKFQLLYSDLKIWVNAAVNHGVEHLHFTLNSWLSMKLPCCVFSCRTLVFLKLHNFHVNVFPSPHLPSLKTLHLSCANFVEPWHLTEIMNACPVLEDLDLFGMAFDIKSYEGELKTFESLVRVSIWDVCSGLYYSSLKPFCNAEFLCIGKYNLPIPLFPNLTHLVLAYDKTWHQLLKVLKHSPNIQILKIELLEEVYTTDYKVIHFPRPDGMFGRKEIE